MTTAQDYARALRELVEKNPKEGKKYLTRLNAALRRRGHEKLLPRIAQEYERLELAATRARKYKTVTPEMERTRSLLELYRTLTQNN